MCWPLFAGGDAVVIAVVEAAERGFLRAVAWRLCRRAWVIERERGREGEREGDRKARGRKRGRERSRERK